jgi:hypothetical protein
MNYDRRKAHEEKLEETAERLVKAAIAAAKEEVKPSAAVVEGMRDFQLRRMTGAQLRAMLSKMTGKPEGHYRQYARFPTVQALIDEVKRLDAAAKAKPASPKPAARARSKSPERKPVLYDLFLTVKIGENLSRDTDLINSARARMPGLDKAIHSLRRKFEEHYSGTDGFKSVHSGVTMTAFETSDPSISEGGIDLKSPSGKPFHIKPGESRPIKADGFSDPIYATLVKHIHKRENFSDVTVY